MDTQFYSGLPSFRTAIDLEYSLAFTPSFFACPLPTFDFISGKERALNTQPQSSHRGEIKR